MSHWWKFAIAVLPLLVFSPPAFAAPGFPSGWSGSGSAPAKDYEVGTAPVAGATGKQAAYIKARPGASPNQFFSLTQCIQAKNYLGKRLRFSARLKSVDASAEQLWMRVDGQTAASDRIPKVLGFYNMDDRPVTGTTDWARYDVVLDVPAESTGICYGFFLHGGKGEAWADSLSLEPVSKDVPVSQWKAPSTPVNLGFDR
jgi:hypothetical protein